MNIFNFLKIIRNKENKNINALDYALKSNVYLTQKKYNQALKQIKTAIAKNPNNDNFLYQKALIYIQMKKYTKALTEINKAVNINPKIYYYYLVRADIYNFLNNLQKEIKDIKYAKELLPKAYLYYNRKFDIENEKGNETTAEYFFNRMQKVKSV
jgi:tetratricopeptide (TPR) repeat protein